ncbi:MrcB family domain-containing protein [Bradyrhizobium sp. 23AC]
MKEWAGTHLQEFSGHPLANHIRGAAKQEVETALGNPKGLSFKGSAGSGRWADVPWIAVYDDVVTDTATEGYYVVYLFHMSEPTVHLSLNQGTTGTRLEFKSATHDVLRERAQLMRRRLPDFTSRLPVTSIDLGSTGELPGDYAAGHAMGISYSVSDLPSDAELASDLQAAVAAYKALTFRGGLDPIAEKSDEDAPGEGASLIEQRRYKLHRRIERNPKAAKAAKSHHGTKCQACELEFHERYGEIGRGFIEAHHLKPIGSLNEGEAVSYDVATDFAVLCSNCHRMIHRTSDPADITGFRLLLKR